MLTAHRPITDTKDYQRLYCMSMAREGRAVKRLQWYMKEHQRMLHRLKEIDPEWEE